MALVEQVLKADTPSLPPEAIAAFVAVDEATLPKRLRRKFAAKKLELYTLKHLAASQRRRAGFLPIPDDCARPKEASATDIAVLRLAGYDEISDREEHFLENKSHCTERDLLCEFSLQIIIENKGKKNERRRYFLHLKDPLSAYVGEFRAGMLESRNTNFFGLGKPVCPER